MNLILPIALSFAVFGQAFAQGLDKLPPDVWERLEREIEGKKQRMLEQRRQNQAATDALWRAKWIPEKLTKPPSSYYIEAYLRALNAEQLEKLDKQRHITEAIEALATHRK